MAFLLEIFAGILYVLCDRTIPNGLMLKQTVPLYETSKYLTRLEQHIIAEKGDKVIQNSIYVGARNE